MTMSCNCLLQGLKLPQALPSKNFPPLSSDLGADVTITDILVRQPPLSLPSADSSGSH